MNPKDKKYPIKPKHLDTSERPKGFDNMLGYTQVTFLWCFMDLFKHRGNWNPFTVSDFENYCKGPGRNVVEKRILILHFLGPTLAALLNEAPIDQKEPDIKIYTPSHFLISTYFMWNPAR